MRLNGGRKRKEDQLLPSKFDTYSISIQIQMYSRIHGTHVVLLDAITWSNKYNESHQIPRTMAATL